MALLHIGAECQVDLWPVIPLFRICRTKLQKMDVNSSSLIALESHISELFSGSAGNERLQKIHEALENFRCQKGAWRDCLYFLSHTNKNETAMYCLTVLENVITRGWLGLSKSEQKELLSTLNHWILEKHEHVPYFIRNKAVQLVVHVARSDWPEAYPEFYHEILQLISSSDASVTLLGLQFLQTASEELGTPRDDLLSARKYELKQRLLQLVPSTLSALSGLLESIWENKTHSITSTPPPSPTQGGSAHSSQYSVVSTNKSSAMNAQMESLARAALQCLTRFFSWIPLSNHVTPHLMELIFRFVGMGTQPSLPVPSSAPVVAVPVVALEVINEVLYKNCVPVEFEDFVVLLFNNACIILHHLVENNKNNHLPDPTHPQFVEKFLELIHLLVSHHLRRLEGRQLPLFSVPNFLSLFFTFTFEQEDWARYATCLDTWQVFLEYIRQSGSKSDSPGSLYQDSLMLLSERILRRILYADNCSQLQLLDDETEDGEMETEWQKVIRQSIEIFVAAGEIVNNRTLSMLNEPFERGASAYQMLASVSASNHGVLRIESKSQVKEMNIIFRDLATLLQFIGRISELHTGKDYEHHFDMGKSLVQRLLDLAACGTVVTRIKFLECDSELSVVLSQVHAHCLSALQAWSHWISLWLAKNDRTQCEALVSALVTAATSILSPSSASVSTTGDEQLKTSVLRASLQLICSLVSVIRSPYLWTSITWNQLFNSVFEIRNLPPTIHRELVQWVLASALVPWRNCLSEEQHWQERQLSLRNVVERATKSTHILLQQLGSEPVSSILVPGKPSVMATLTLLADLAAVVRNENSSAKNALHYVLSQWMEPVLTILSFYTHDNEITEAVFNFYLAVFSSLLNQIGHVCAQRAVQLFLQTFTQQNIQAVIQEESSHGIRALEQFLRILQIVAQEPGGAFKHFLPSTLFLCLDHIYPLIAQKPSSLLKETFYELLTLILHHNWRYFFKGSVLNNYGSRELDRTEPVEHQAQLMSIMAAYGQSFLLPDINIFQQNLQALESLQSKWKLYHKAIFRDAVASQFIHTLLNVLTNGSHELLSEEIAISIYSMASPDLDGFFQTILPAFLLNSQGIIDQQRLVLKNDFSNDTDLPSFTRNVHRLCNDLRCYRIANASVANSRQS